MVWKPARGSFSSGQHDTLGAVMKSPLFSLPPLRFWCLVLPHEPFSTGKPQVLLIVSQCLGHILTHSGDGKELAERVCQATSGVRWAKATCGTRKTNARQSAPAARGPHGLGNENSLL